MATISVDFSKNNCNYLHKNKLDAIWHYHLCILLKNNKEKYSWIQFLTEWRPMNFSPGTVVIIAMEVGTYGHHDQNINR